MLLYILIPFLLGLLFAYLTVTGFRRFAAWATAARLNAKISADSVHDAYDQCKHHRGCFLFRKGHI